MIRKYVATLFALAASVVGALADSSTINPNVPAQGAPLASAPIRGNFAAAANDINRIFALVPNPVNGPLTTKTGNVALWGNTTGTLLSDGGLVDAGPVGLLLTNDGTATGFSLVPKYGSRIPLWCAATSNWQTFTMPLVGISGNVTSVSIDGVAAQSIKGNDLALTVTVVDAANNGSGLIRLQVADSSLFSAAAGVGYIITGATGTGALPAAINSFSAAKVWSVTIIDATHVDLVGSTFTTGTYTANSATVGVGVPYFVYVKLDTGCTVASFDISALQSYVYAAAPGIAVNGGSAVEPMVGMLVKRHGTIQGGAGEELLITWYNYGRSTFATTFSGNTSGATSTYVQMAGAIEILIWSEHMPLVRSDCSITGNSALATIGFALTASGSYVRTILGQDNGVQQTQLDIAPASPKIFPVQFPFSSLTGGLWVITGWLMTTEGTATVGSINPCNVAAFSVF